MGHSLTQIWFLMGRWQWFYIPQNFEKHTDCHFQKHQGLLTRDYYLHGKDHNLRHDLYGNILDF